MQKKPIWRKIFGNQKSYELSAISKYDHLSTCCCQFFEQTCFLNKIWCDQSNQTNKTCHCVIFLSFIPIILGSHRTIKFSPGLSSPSSLLTVVRIFDIFWAKIIHEQTTLNVKLKYYCRPAFTLTSKTVSDKILWLALHPEPVNLF